ncbi:hypothetical protein ACP275_02G025600 [Erythranthe tilingii]
MKSKLKNGWRSIMPIHTQGELAARFCVFPKLNKSASCSSPGKTRVYLNVYDLTTVNGYFYWAGVGVFHSGIEVHGSEYAFGAHDYPTSGVFEVEPRQCPGFNFRKSIFIGTTNLDQNQIKEFMEDQSANYHGDTYHLVVKNCNHFCEDMCYKLTGKRIPKWVNRLARIGSFCNCILPEALKTNTSNYRESDCEKKSLRGSSLRCFSSISMHQKERENEDEDEEEEVSISSLFLHSHYKGCLPNWDLKKFRSKSVKEG